MRSTVCVPRYGTDRVLQHGDQEFDGELERLYATDESKALDSLIHLKANLKGLHGDGFFTAVTEGMASILDAEMSFVMKRVLMDDTEAPVEMPPYGEPGSCMMAAAFHHRSDDGTQRTTNETKFAAYGSPCEYMRHDKVFIIPERLREFIPNNPNDPLPTAADAYIGLPLIAEGRNIGHYGCMWSQHRNAQRKLSWGFIELLLNSLEDLILQRLIQGSSFVKSSPTSERKRSVIPHDAFATRQSLRPYAGSLSHELRTPMQGVVGTLDIIYMTVEDARLNAENAELRAQLDYVKRNIEIVQDSSRRAVEAADNVVHAYDMDMSVPAANPLPLDDSDSLSPLTLTGADKRPGIVVAGSNLPLNRPNKRIWEEVFSRQASNASCSKLPRIADAHDAWVRAVEPSQNIVNGVHEAEDVHARVGPNATLADAPTAEDVALAEEAIHPAGRRLVPGLRHTSMRELFQFVINEGLKVGGRPEMAFAQDTGYGEIIEVRSRGSDGTVRTKTIDWSVDPNCPHSIFADEKDLSKLISCVFLNAIKFTDQNGGRVVVRARMSSRGKYLSVKIADNGPGIPAAFLPKLFQPFAREDASITRTNEGLGLGLMVAKGIARKLGGDLMCTRAQMGGLQHGSEFEIKVPLFSGDTITRSSSPWPSPSLKHAVLHQEAVRTPPSPPQTSNGTTSPTVLSSALQDLVDRTPTNYRSATLSTPSPKTQPASLHKPFLPPVTVTSSPPTPPNGSALTLNRPKLRKSVSNPEVDRNLAVKYPLNLLIAEDNKINRLMLASMLKKLGYKNIIEAHDGAEAVRQMALPRPADQAVNMVLMDLWMPLMDGYEAAERIMGMYGEGKKPTVLAVTADVTDGTQARVAEAGMRGLLTKPYKMHDLQRLITEFCANHSEL